MTGNEPLAAALVSIGGRCHNRRDSTNLKSVSDSDGSETLKGKLIMPVAGAQPRQ